MNFADSNTTVVVVSFISEFSPPMMPAIPIAPLPVGNEQRLIVKYPFLSIEGHEFFALLRSSDDDFMASNVAIVKRVHRLAGL